MKRISWHMYLSIIIDLALKNGYRLDTADDSVAFVLICAFMNHFTYHKNQESSGTVKIMYITETVFKISYTYYKIILFSAPCYDERIIFRNSKMSLGSQGFFFFFSGGTLSSLLHIKIIEN